MAIAPYRFVEKIQERLMQEMGVEAVEDLHRIYRDDGLLPKYVENPKNFNDNPHYIAVPLSKGSEPEENADVIAFGAVYGIRTPFKPQFSRLSPKSYPFGAIRYESLNNEGNYATIFFDLHSDLVRKVIFGPDGKDKVPNLESIEGMSLDEGVEELFLQIHGCVPKT